MYLHHHLRAKISHAAAVDRLCRPGSGIRVQLLLKAILLWLLKSIYLFSIFPLLVLGFLSGVRYKHRVGGIVGNSMTSQKAGI